MTGCPAAADDLVHDAVERALRHLDRFEPGTDLGAWIARIVHNLHVNRRLQDANRRRLVERAPRQGAVSGRQLERLLLRDAARALDALRDQEREAVVLVGLQGVDYAEAARALGCPPGTVRSRASKGRARMRAMVEGDAPGAATARTPTIGWAG